MLSLTLAQARQIGAWFEPEGPGQVLVGPHVLHTGHGAWWADRWPDPRVVLAETGANYVLRGAAAALAPADLPAHVAGFVDAPPVFVPLLAAAYGAVAVWPRVLYRLDRVPASLPAPPAVEVRPLAAGDGPALVQMGVESSWIYSVWGGAQALASSGLAWGAFVGRRLVAVSCVFFVGAQCADLGVVTLPSWRGRGLSAVCSAALCEDVLARGRVPTWSTSFDNVASMRVAEKVGFARVDAGQLYVVNASIPAARASR
jgi:GNAT superfamily N-acetyltransferase